MNRTVKNIIITMLFTILAIFLVNGSVMAAATPISASATWTASSGTIYKYDYTNKAGVTEYDFEKYAHSYAKLSSMPATWLRGRYTNINTSEGYTTISQSHAICLGHGNSYASNNDSNGNYLYKIAAIIDVTPTIITGNGNGRVGSNYLTMTDPISYSVSYKVTSKKESTRILSGLAYYLHKNGTSSSTCYPVSKLFGTYRGHLAEDQLLDYGIGINGYSDSTTSAWSGAAVTYANKVQNHDVSNKSSVSANADRKVGTYSGTTYDYWGPFQVTYSSDISSITVSTSNAGTYKGIASSVGGQPQTASTSTIKSNTSFYVVTTTTTATSTATITVKTSTNSDYYKARIIIFKHSGKAKTGNNTAQNIMVWATDTTSMSDSVSISVTPSAKPGSFTLTKKDASGNAITNNHAKFQLIHPDNGQAMHFSGSAGSYTRDTSATNTTLETNNSGTLTVTNLPGGLTYTLKEISAPTGYILNSSNVSVNIPSGGSTSVSVTNNKYGSLSVTKVDSENNSKKLAGAKFNLYSGSTKLKFTGSTGSYTYSTSGTITDLVTNSSGNLNVSQLEAGTYTLKEITAPTGYKVNSSNISVTIKNNTTTQQTVENDLVDGTLEIFKYDSKTGTSKPLSGAKFVITVKSQNNRPIVATRNSAGNYTYTGLTTSMPTYFETNSSGKITISDIPAYFDGVATELVIQETTAPVGYKKYTGDLSATIKSNTTSKVNVPEDSETVNLKIVKKSTDDPDKKVSGIGFKVLCTGVNSNYPDGWIKASNGQWNGSFYSYTNADTFYTNSEGYVTISGLPLRGSYTVYEVDLGNYKEFQKLPSNTGVTCYSSTSYTSMSTITGKQVEIVPSNSTEDGGTYTVTAYNDENPGKLQVQKIDLGNANRVDGLGFKIFDETEGQWLQIDTGTGKISGRTPFYNQATEIKTDSTGYTKQITALPLGTYHVYETSLGSYSDIYKLEDTKAVVVFTGQGGMQVNVNVKDCGSYTITSSNTVVQVKAENEPNPVGGMQIQKIDTSGKGRVNGIGFKVYDETNKKWLTFNTTTGEYTGLETYYDSGTQIVTDSTGYTVELNNIPEGTYHVYETSLGSYSSLYKLEDSLSVNNATGTTTINVKDCGSYTVDKEHVDVQNVRAENTPIEILGSIIIKKIDVSDGHVVSGIGFKIFDFTNKKWLQIDETTGEITGNTADFEQATELTTDSTGYTVKVKDVPAGEYKVFETNLNENIEYTLGTVEVYDEGTTKTVTGKQIDGLYYITPSLETNIEVTARNTKVEIPGKIIIKKTDKGTGNVVSGIGFKIFESTSQKWLKIDTTTGEITGDTQKFEESTELTTGSTGYTVQVVDVPKGTYQVYETNLGTHNEYKLGKVNVYNEGSQIEVTGKLIGTYEVDDTGIEVEAKAENEQLGKIRIRKVDTSDEDKIVDGIGFKLVNANSNEWLVINENTGKVTGVTMSYDEATTIYTKEDGYTMEISDVPLDWGGSYAVYETDISAHPEYEFEGTINVPHNNGTKTVEGKRIRGICTAKNTGEIVTITAQNTPTEQKISLSGYVWENGLNLGKTATMDNVYDTSISKDQKLSGINVYLLDSTGAQVKSTTTDANGNYKFTDIEVGKLSEYSISFGYNGLKYQTINNYDINGVNTNKCIELSREEYNQKFSTINKGKTATGETLTYTKNGHTSTLRDNNNQIIRAQTKEKIASSEGIIGTTTSGESIASIDEIKNDGIIEITNINLGVYKRTAPDLEVREYMYQLISTDKEDTDVDSENTWQVNKMGINSDLVSQNEYAVAMWDAINGKVITKTGKEAKKVYAVYKVALVNSSTGINNKINSITTRYYNSSYTFVIAEVANSTYSNPTKVDSEKITIDGDTVTLNNLDIDVKSRKTAYVYFKFEIPVEELAGKLEEYGEIRLDKNYTEIDSYTSYTGENSLYAGVDKDSAPGNINIELYGSSSEDDEGCSPTMWLTGTRTSRTTVAAAQATDFIDKLMSAKFSEE